MKALMYHYVREPVPSFPQFRFLHVEDFKRQLEWLSERHTLMRVDEVEPWLSGESSFENHVLLTFDDGLKDHFTYVYPELQKRGITGVFYIPAGPCLHGQVLDVHLVHHLIGAFPAAELLAKTLPHVAPEMIDDARRAEFATLTYRNHQETDDVHHFKRLLNYFVLPQFRTGLLEQLTARLGFSLAVDDVYMTSVQLRTMQQSGMVLGSHAVNHRPMSQLTEAQQSAEITDSFAWLERTLGGLKLKTYCHPYGGFHSFNATTERLLDEAGVRFSFNVEPRDVTLDDVRKRPQALPRYDCNQFPHGQLWKAA